MAKRRNLKKEKAVRNKAYARKFRKAPEGRFHRRRDFNRDSDQGAAESKQQDLYSATDESDSGATPNREPF
jgi:hypothetical protein